VTAQRGNQGFTEIIMNGSNPVFGNYFNLPWQGPRKAPKTIRRIAQGKIFSSKSLQTLIFYAVQSTAQHF
jgi:hypothetical protein